MPTSTSSAFHKAVSRVAMSKHPYSSVYQDTDTDDESIPTKYGTNKYLVATSSSMRDPSPSELERVETKSMKKSRERAANMHSRGSRSNVSLVKARTRDDDDDLRRDKAGGEQRDDFHDWALPTTLKQSKGGIGWHCTRNVMLSSLALALVLLLRALLSSAPSPSLDKSWNRQNQSTATASHVNHEHFPANNSEASHFPANNRKEVPTAFVIRPNRTYAAYRGGSRLETFHSFVPLPNGGGYQVVYKVNQKDDSLSSGRAQSVETRQLSPSFEPVNSTSLMLGKGWYSAAGHIHNQSGLSDPRAFYWNDCPYALTWRHAGHDHANFLFNLVTGEEYQLDDCVRGYRGKNWVPLVYHGELYVIHRLSPRLKWFKFDLQRGCPTPRNKANVDTSIDEYRGGTSFVPLGPTSMIALGHRTIDGNTHTPYLLHVEMADGTIRSRKAKIRQMLSQERSWSGILDPTSLWWDNDGKLWMGTVGTSGSWKRCYFKDIDECVFNMTIYEVELKYEDPAGLTNYTLI